MIVREGTADGTTVWKWQLRLGRLQVRTYVYRHHYAPGLSDRWVLEPSLIYDRKRAA